MCSSCFLQHHTPVPTCSGPLGLKGAVRDNIRLDPYIVLLFPCQFVAVFITPVLLLISKGAVLRPPEGGQRFAEAARYQFGAQAGNRLGYPRPAYSASHPTSVTFSTMYNQRGGVGSLPQHSSSLIQANTSALSPSASRSLDPTPMAGSQATLLESPLSEDPLLVGLGVHGSAYNLPDQSNVRARWP